MTHRKRGPGFQADLEVARISALDHTCRDALSMASRTNG